MTNITDKIVFECQEFFEKHGRPASVISLDETGYEQFKSELANVLVYPVIQGFDNHSARDFRGMTVVCKKNQNTKIVLG